MSVQLGPAPVFKAFDNNGAPLFGGQLFTYAAGTTTPLATFTDSTGVTQNTNPIVLNARGECNLWLTASAAYKLQLQDSFGNIIWTVDNVTVSVYSQLDIRRYGGDPTGVNASDAAMAAAIAACGSAGGTILMPSGTYLFNNSISLDSKANITIQGDGSANAAIPTPTILQFSSTGAGNFIFAGSSTGCALRKLSIVPAATFSGTLVALGHGVAASDANFFSIDNCTIGSVANTVCTHLNLDKSVIGSFTRVNFVGGATPVKGQASAGGSYSNAMLFDGCQFGSSSLNPINYLGDAWTIRNCTFEGVTSGATTIAGAVGTIATTPLRGLVFEGNWCGDVTGGTGTWLTLFGDNANSKGGAVIQGNFFGGSANSVAVSLNSISGVAIQSNYFDTFGNCISFDTTTIAAVTITNNSFADVTTVLGGTKQPTNLVFNPNQPLVTPALALGLGSFAANGFSVDANGIIEQWGSATVTEGTPLTVTFATNGISFPNAIWNAQATLVSPSAGGNTVYVTSPATASMVLNVAGTAGSNTVHWRARGN